MPYPVGACSSGMRLATTNGMAGGNDFLARTLVLAPISCWPLDDKLPATLRDASVNVRDGIYGGTTYVPLLRQPGRSVDTKAAYFSGAKYALPYTAGLAGAFTGDEFTLSIWAKLDESWSTTTQRYLFRLGVDANNFVGIYKVGGANRLDVYRIAGGASKYVYNLSFSPSGWFNVVVVCSKAEDYLACYINGLESGNRATELGSWAGALTTAFSYIGASNAQGNLGWKGWLGYASVWDRALSGNEVEEQYGLHVSWFVVRGVYAPYVQTVHPADMLGYFPMCERDGAVMHDLSPLARNGYYSGISLHEVGSGDGNRAPYFNGTSMGKFYSDALANAFDPANITVSLWLKLNGAWDTSSTGVLMLGADITANYLRITKPAVIDEIQAQYIAGSSVKSVPYLQWFPSGWFHMGVVVNESDQSFTLYINGVWCMNIRYVLGTWTGALTKLLCTVGSQGQPSAGWVGWLAHLAIWNVALTQPEIDNLANIHRYTPEPLVFQGTSNHVGIAASNNNITSLFPLCYRWIRAQYPTRWFPATNTALTSSNSWRSLAMLDIVKHTSPNPIYVEIDFHNDNIVRNDGDITIYPSAREAWIRRIWGMWPDANICVIIWPQITVGGDFYETNIYRDAIISLCDYYGVQYIDVHHVLWDMVTNLGYTLTDYFNPADYVHPLDLGQTLAATLLQTHLPTLIDGPRQFGTGSTLPARQNDCSAYEHGTEQYIVGSAYDSKTGTWAETDVFGWAGNGCMVSTEAGATITYSGNFHSVGINKGPGVFIQTGDYQIDGGTWVLNATLSDNGLAVAAYGAHTITFRVPAAGSLNISHFLAV